MFNGSKIVYYFYNLLLVKCVTIFIFMAIHKYNELLFLDGYIIWLLQK